MSNTKFNDDNLSPSYLRKRNERVFRMRAEEKMKVAEVADALGISAARVAQIFKVEARRRNYLRPTDRARRDIQDIINHYNKDMHTTDIAKMYNVSDRFIRLLLEQHGVYRQYKNRAIKASSKTTPLNEWNEESEYFLGFTIGLGELHYTTATIVIRHSNQAILRQLAAIAYGKKTPKAVTQDEDGAYVLRIISRPLFTSLTNLGMLHKETGAVTPNKELLNSYHFWRGLIDSSGTIGFTPEGDPFVKFRTASTTIKEGLILFMSNLVDLSLDPRTGEWVLFITERSVLNHFLQKVYAEGSPALRLLRSYERALMIREALGVNK